MMSHVGWSADITYINLFGKKGTTSSLAYLNIKMQILSAKKNNQTINLLGNNYYGRPLHFTTQVYKYIYIYVFDRMK